jgi:hypothetical protein
MKKIIYTSFLIIALLFSQSCATKYLWGNKSYEEQIEQFFVGADGRSIAFIGRNYHYVFSDNSGLLRMILSLKQRSVLSINPKKTYLKLESNNDITGDLVLEGPSSILPLDDYQILRSAGFFPNSKDIISIKIPINGRRYAPRFLGANVASNLKENYLFNIYYEDSNVVKDVGKIAITPIAVSLDAVYVVGKIIAFPFSDDKFN